jgi:hypothetical protein
MRWAPRQWWLWYCGWKVCMWMALHTVSRSLTWYDLAYRFGRRCRDAGGPKVTGVVRDGEHL